MSKYTGINVRSLTLEDALNDTDWGKKPVDYMKYITIDFPILQSIAEDFTADEAKHFISVLALYYVNGIEPNYSSIQSSGVKQAVRFTIAAQTERLESVYLLRYKQYVSSMITKEKQQEEKQNNT